MLKIIDDNIGGGHVRRTFKMGLRQRMGGEVLSADEVRSIQRSNLRALIDNHFIEIWPVSAPSKGEHHIIHRGGGQFDVIEGVKLNAKPLSKDEAEELATRPE